MAMTIRLYRLAAAATAVLVLLPAHGAAAIAIDVATQANLGFGQIVATTTSGAVTVSPSGNRTRSGGVVLGNGFGVSAASFTVTGDPNTNFSITLPGSSTLSGGGGTMTASDFTSSPSEAGNLGTSGTLSVTMGATLQVGASQAAAAYLGTYAVTVAYN